MEALIYDTDRLRLATLARNVQDLGLKWIAVAKVEDIKKRMQKKKFDMLILDASAIRVLNKLKKLDSVVPVVILADKNEHVDFQNIIFVDKHVYCINKGSNLQLILFRYSRFTIDHFYKICNIFSFQLFF